MSLVVDLSWIFFYDKCIKTMMTSTMGSVYYEARTPMEKEFKSSRDDGSWKEILNKLSQVFKWRKKGIRSSLIFFLFTRYRSFLQVLINDCKPGCNDLVYLSKYPVRLLICKLQKQVRQYSKRHCDHEVVCRKDWFWTSLINLLPSTLLRGI